MITIDPEFHSLIPPLTADERRQLEENIIADGVRDPLVVWDGILVDGHNRHEICERLNIPYATVSKSFDSRDDAKAWIIRNQFGRRNLSMFHRAELALQLEPLIAAKAKANQLAGVANLRHGDSPVQQETAKPGNAVSPSFREAINTRAEVAKIAGVSHDTIHKAKVIRNEATEEVKEQLREGKTTVGAAYAQLRPETRRVSKPREYKPDFSRVSPNAATPVIPLSSARPEPMVTITIPDNPIKAATAFARRFDADFIRAFATQLLADLDEAPASISNQ